MNYKLSVITINYNNKAGLIKTIESVITQTCKQFEFIVIDGNSTDGSKEVLEQYKEKFTYCVSEPDNGIYNAMNKGIKAANGEYLLFMNSGDMFYEPSVLSNCIDSLSQDYDFVYGNAIFENNGKHSFTNYPNQLTFSFFLTDSLCHQATFIKRSLFDNNPYNENFKIISDWEFFILKICRDNKSYLHINTIIAVFDAADGASAKQLSYNALERQQTLETNFPTFLPDYTYVSNLKLRRVKQLSFISKRPIAWSIVKAVINIVLFCIPSAKEELWRK